MTEPQCPRCGESAIVTGVKMSLSSDVGTVGPEYTEARGLGSGKTEPLLADLCPACGTVVRLFVANPARKWRTQV